MLLWCLPGSVRLVGMHREPAVVPEILFAANDAYRARAAARFPMYECIPRPNIINLPCLVLAIMFSFVVAWSPWENHTNPQFGPCLSLTK